MDPELTFRDTPGDGAGSPAEQILLWAVRLASLPFLALVVVLAASIYGVAGLGRHAAALAAVVLGRPPGPGEIRDPRVGARDA
jgi:hypothetical protein